MLAWGQRLSAEARWGHPESRGWRGQKRQAERNMERDEGIRWGVDDGVGRETEKESD